MSVREREWFTNADVTKAAVALAITEDEAKQKLQERAGQRKRDWPKDELSDLIRSRWVVDYVDSHGRRHIKTFKKKKDADTFAATAHVEVREGTRSRFRNRHGEGRR